MLVRYDNVYLTDFDYKKHNSLFVKLHNDGLGHDFQNRKTKITVSGFEQNPPNTYAIYLKDAAKQSSRVGFLRLPTVDLTSRTAEFELLLEQEPEKLAKHGKSIVCAAIELLIAVKNFRKITIKLNIDDAEQINILKNLGFTQEVRRRRHQYSNRNHSTIIDFAFSANGDK